MRLYSFILFSILILTIRSTTSLTVESDGGHIHPDFDEISAESKPFRKEELKSKYWNDLAQDVIKAKLKQEIEQKKAKNIIFFLGDGMSVHTLTATRAYIKDVSHQLSFEKFPYLGLAKTYCVNAQVADSACSATAYLSGVKNNIDMIGVTAAVNVDECDENIVQKNKVDSIAQWAQEAKKSVGVVTTTRITHATPSGTYAHIGNRNWETDAWVDDKCKGHKIHDIADQLITGDGSKFNVIMGGGRSLFLGENIRGEEGEPGIRKDGRNLIKEWLQKKDVNAKAKYIWNRKQLMQIDADNTDYLLGLFSADHLPYHGDTYRSFRNEGDPSLSEMTEAAMKVLSKNSEGFFLLVEGGRIDHAHHYVKARKALEETKEFAKAVDAAVKRFGNTNDTLIVVTSDHSHTMTINGYPNRNSDILGLSGDKDDDKKPYPTISYANGEGFYTVFPKDKKGRKNLSKYNYDDPELDYPSHVPLEKETHGGEDVGIFATGPQAHLFVGNYEQSYIPLLMAKITEIGPYKSKK